MKIILLGGTGNIGNAILKEALSKGHEVTSVQRDSNKLSVKDSKLKAISGDLFNYENLVDQIKGYDVIISALAPTFGNEESFKSLTKNVISLAKESGISRVIAIGGAGSLEVSPGVELVDSDKIKGYPAEWLPTIKVHKEAREIYRNSDLDWTFFSPAEFIEHGDRTNKFRLGGTSLVVDKNGSSKISIEDYAIAMIDEAESNRHIKEQFTIGY